MDTRRRFLGLPSEHRASLGGVSTQQSLAIWARAVLLSADGLTGREVAERTELNISAVFGWRRRIRGQGRNGPRDLPRSGRPHLLSPEKAKEILTLVVERVPHEASHGSIRLIAKYAQVSTWKPGRSEPS